MIEVFACFDNEMFRYVNLEEFSIDGICEEFDIEPALSATPIIELDDEGDEFQFRVCIRGPLAVVRMENANGIVTTITGLTEDYKPHPLYHPEVITSW